MQPQTTQTNRKQLFFCYFMDCQTPQKPGGGRDQTWDIAERAVRGLVDLFEERGLVHALGLCSEPEVVSKQSALFNEMAQRGAWQALHFQVRGYRPPGAAADYDWERPLTFYEYDEQREVLEIAKDHWEQAMGMATEDYGACCAQANDYTFPILADLGFRQCYVSGPGRYNPDPKVGHLWWGAFPHSHHVSSKNRLVPGELDLYEFTLTRTLTPEQVAPNVWMTTDFRAEYERSFDDTMATARASVEDMIRRDHPILYVQGPTHNTWDVGDRTSGRRKAIETAIDVTFALAEELGLAVVPASLKDMHAEADRLNAY